PTSTKQEPVPTQFVTTCPTPGTYTFPATTVVVTSTTTVCEATSHPLTPGHNTYGGVTTEVTTSTTVTCPYAAVETSNGVETTVLSSTVYVCPSAGTYTPIPATTTSVPVSTVLVYPIPATYTPGTYTRDETVVTVTETDFVYVCPYTASVIPVPAPTSETPAPPPAQTSETPAQTSETPAKPSSSAPPSQGGIKSNGDQWAITYTPYSSNGACKTSDEVNADISIIAGKGFTTVRLYATDCSGLENVGSACSANGIRMIIGVFIDAGGISKAREQVTQIVSWGKFDLVDLVVVGNEAIFNGYCSAGELASFIGECKDAFTSAGYSGPVTTTEPLNIIQLHAATLCPAVDVAAANIQPFFNPETSPELAGTFVAGQLALVSAACGGKDAYNLECGWPSSGSANGVATPGTDAQRVALQGIASAVGSRTVFFSFNNDDWKHPGTFGVEQHFGCVDIF
ncbi:glycoside hydrolase, partial [Eremomyces bilateralis CBS 781.70]